MIYDRFIRVIMDNIKIIIKRFRLLLLSKWLFHKRIPAYLILFIAKHKEQPQRNKGQKVVSNKEE